LLTACIVAQALRALLVAGVPLQASEDSSPPISRSTSDSALVEVAKREPDSLRAALSTARALAAHRDTDSSRAGVEFSRRLATAYAAAWNDSFFVRQVSRFAAEPPAWRRRWVAADSVRRGAIANVSRIGAPAAIRLWRGSAREFRALSDSSGLAAAVGNLGAGFYLEGELDSAGAYLERARRLAIAVGDKRTEANVVGTLASVEKDRGSLRESRVLYERALVLRELSGDRRGMAADRNNLGLVAQSLGDFDGARRAFLAALADNRVAGRQHSVAINLTNLANLASLTGDSPAADSLYRQALAIHSSLGERDDQAVVLHNLALLQMRRADYDGALVSLRRALALTDSTGATMEHLAELTDLASLQAARGEVEEGLTTIRRAQSSAEAASAPGDLRARMAMARGELAVSLNRLADAERDYARAAQLAAAAGERSLQAEAQRGQALLLIERQHYEQATVVLAASIRNHQAGGDVRGAAASRISLGYAQGQKGDTAHARRSLSTARGEMRSAADPAGEAAALATLGNLELGEGALLAAEADFRRGIQVMGANPTPDVAWRLHAGLGAALRARGALPEACTELRTAIAYIERTAGRLRLPEQRSGYRADKWDVYATLAFTEQQRGRTAEAFEASERLRARQALELLDRGTVRYSADDSTAAEEQALRHRVDELTRLVDGGPPTETSLRGANDDASARDAARNALAEAENEYDAFLLEHRAVDTASVRLSEVATMSGRQVSAQLRADELLLEYLITDSAATVFALTSDTVFVADLDLRRRELAALVDYARDAIARTTSRSVTDWRAPLQRLYGLLMQPIEDAGLLRGRNRIIVVPHAELHFLPFGALMRPGKGDHFLVESASILTAPSATLWLRLTQRARSAEGGILALAPRIDVLPASEREVDAIRKIYGSSATILRGGRATREAFVTGAPTSSVVHLASLGVLNKHNPLFSFVELSPHGSDDGRLEVTDVLALRMRAKLVTLSACQTALGAGALADVPAGDEWVGFTSAFLRAGARDVLATLWPVEDAATATLMATFYRVFETGVPAADALAEAQREAIRDQGRAVPFLWAGFVVTGAR